MNDIRPTKRIKRQNRLKEAFLRTESPNPVFAITVVMAMVYLLAMAFFFPKGNSILFWFLIIGQTYSTWQVLSFIHTVWNTSYRQKKMPDFTPPVDIFITVVGEPVDIVAETVKAALDMDYPNHRVYVCNDGFVAKKENWKEIEEMTRSLGAECITRTVPGGAKAGNINHALSVTSAPFFVVFDCDHVPHKNFLREMMPYFADPKMAFVQSPQYYKNMDLNYVTSASWEQQQLFYGPILKGKNRMNCVTMCGTNMAIRRQAIMEVGGMCATNIAEDFVTGLFIHERGWKSAYVPKILAEGLAPEDFLSYYKQQFRWSRGSLEVLFKFNPIFKRTLTWQQKVQYLATSAFHVSGLVHVIYAIIPLIFFYTGAVPFLTSTMALALVFIPYIFLVFYALQRSSNFTYTFRALAFSMALFPVHFKALWAVLTNQKSSFAVTSKRQVEGNFINLVIPHLVYIALVIVGTGVALAREGLSPSVATNIAWALFNVTVFLPFIKAALPEQNSTRAASIDTAHAVRA